MTLSKRTLTQKALLLSLSLGLGISATAQAKTPVNEKKSQVVDAHEFKKPKKKPTKKKRRVTKKPKIDVVFAVDATSSMSDEIDVIRKEIWSIANKLATGKPAPDIRFGLVLYKDIGDDFVVRSSKLTRDVDAMHKEIMSISVSGGGDTPEHVGRGLHEALNLNWDMNQSTTRLVYLVGDAPSHQKEGQKYSLPDALQKAKAKNIKIHTIGCSGLGDGQREFQQIAMRTSGAFNPLTYHAIVKRDDGKKVSVVYQNGHTYEADGVLSDKEWKGGAEKLKKSKKVRRASKSVKSRAKAAPKMNNAGAAMEDSLLEEAKAAGSAY